MGVPASVQAGDRKVGDEAEPLVVGPITRTHIVRYAGASGDFTPIHHHEPLAQQVGLPRVFSMGMMQGGMLAHLVADWLGLANVRRFSIRAKPWPSCGMRRYSTGRPRPRSTEWTISLSPGGTRGSSKPCATKSGTRI